MNPFNIAEEETKTIKYLNNNYSSSQKDENSQSATQKQYQKQLLAARSIFHSAKQKFPVQNKGHGRKIVVVETLQNFNHPRDQAPNYAAFKKNKHIKGKSMDLEELVTKDEKKAHINNQGSKDKNKRNHSKEINIDYRERNSISQMKQYNYFSKKLNAIKNIVLENNYQAKKKKTKTMNQAEVKSIKKQLKKLIEEAPLYIKPRRKSSAKLTQRSMKPPPHNINSKNLKKYSKSQQIFGQSKSIKSTQKQKNHARNIHQIQKNSFTIPLTSKIISLFSNTSSVYNSKKQLQTINKGKSFVIPTEESVQQISQIRQYENQILRKRTSESSLRYVRKSTPINSIFQEELPETKDTTQNIINFYIGKFKEANSFQHQLSQDLEDISHIPSQNKQVNQQFNLDLMLGSLNLAEIHSISQSQHIKLQSSQVVRMAENAVVMQQEQQLSQLNGLIRQIQRNKGHLPQQQKRVFLGKIKDLIEHSSHNAEIPMSKKPQHIQISKSDLNNSDLRQSIGPDQNISIINLEMLDKALRERQAYLTERKERELLKLQQFSENKGQDKNQERGKIIKWIDREIKEVVHTRHQLWKGFNSAKHILQGKQDNTITKKKRQMMKCLSDKYLGPKGRPKKDKQAIKEKMERQKSENSENHLQGLGEGRINQSPYQQYHQQRHQSSQTSSVQISLQSHDGDSESEQLLLRSQNYRYDYQNSLSQQKQQEMAKDQLQKRQKQEENLKKKQRQQQVQKQQNLKKKQKQQEIRRQENLKKKLYEQEIQRQQTVKRKQRQQEAQRQQILKKKQRQQFQRQQVLRKKQRQQEAQRQQVLRKKQRQQEAQRQQVLKKKQKQQEAQRQQVLRKKQRQQVQRQQVLKKKQRQQEAQRQQVLRKKQRQQVLKKKQRQQEAQRQQVLRKKQRQQEAQRQQVLKKKQKQQEAQRQQVLKKKQRQQEAQRQQILKKKQHEQEVQKQQILKQKQQYQIIQKEQQQRLKQLYKKQQQEFKQQQKNRLQNSQDDQISEESQGQTNNDLKKAICIPSQSFQKVRQPESVGLNLQEIQCDIQYQQSYNEEEIQLLTKQSQKLKLQSMKIPFNLSVQDKEDIYEFIFLDLCIELTDQYGADSKVMKKIYTFIKTMKEQSKKQKGFKTNTNSIKEYLYEFISFLKNKLQFLQQVHTNIDKPLGPTALDILKYMHVYEEEQMEEQSNQTVFILDLKIFEHFQNEYLPKIVFQTYYEDQQKQRKRRAFLKNAIHIHNKAIFDALNQTLDKQRPFGVWGQPFSWKKTAKFYHQRDAALKNTVILKSAQKTIQFGAYMCGFMVDKQDCNLKANPNITQAYIDQIRDDRLSRMLANDLQESEQKMLFIDDQETQILVQVSLMIFQTLVQQVSRDVRGIKLFMM